MRTLQRPIDTAVYRRRSRAKSQSGQSLIIALAVLFLLGFLGALFASIVVRNLTSAQNANETINTDYFAQAGVNYANTMLETSQQGADWRPPLQYVDATETPAAVTLEQNVGLGAPPTQDPDYKWLNNGYTRYNMNGGRFLLKVTYNPSGVNATTTTPAASPTGKFIEIDSIGRLGVVDSSDPTTYTQNPPDLRRSELTAYKPIGIVDYSRFITNKDSRTDTANLGVPSVAVTPSGGSTPTVVTPGVFDIDPASLPTGYPYNPTEYPLVTTYGSPTGYGSLAATGSTINQLGGGSLRSNMNLRLYGVNNVYLNTAYGDDWEIAGNLTFDNYATPATTAAYSQLPAQCELYYPDGTTPTTTDNGPVYPSNDVTNFTTYSGAIRDSNSGNDGSGYPRQIHRLNPPLIDTVDAATGLTRYQALTGGSEVQVQQYATTADYTPATVNVNNVNDIQHESLNALGGYTLRGDWLNPGAGNTSGNWDGTYYNPPGTLITLGELSALPPGAGTSSNDQYGVTITRTDGVSWTSTAGAVNTYTLRLSYLPKPAAVTANPDTNGFGYLDADQLTNAAPNDVVIYASGNVRIRGIVSDPTTSSTDLGGEAPRHITIVTNGIAYIDGSILKGNPQSSIAILARQYVCINTTQFLAGATNFNSAVTAVTGIQGTDTLPSALSFTGSDSLDEESLYAAPYVGALSTGTNYNYNLYVSQSAAQTGQPTGGQVQYDDSVPPTSLVPATFNPPTLSVVVPYRNVFALSTNPTWGQPFTLTFSKSDAQSGDWLMQRAAVLPGDIHIEAVLYAQDNSFFVIPGDWFNTDSSDNLTHAFDRLANDNATADARYPFYGQPIDMQITIDGAVSENEPADISDEAAWMQKWGWIPRYHGYNSLVSTQEVSPHAIPNVMGTPQLGIGLNLTYDYSAGYPYTFNGTTVTNLRQDRFGRPLPFAPALPVSPDLLYSGQPTT